YDEVMDYQRREFYSQRQRILEGRDLEGLLMDMIEPTVSEAVGDYLDSGYVHRCIAEWAAQALQISITEDQVRADTPEELPGLEANLREMAKYEAGQVIGTTLGEYMGDDLEQREWDLRGLSGWAMSRFGVSLSQNQLRKMTPEEVAEALEEAAGEKIDQLDLSEAGRYLEPGFAEQALAEWAANKFGIAVSAEEFADSEEEVAEALVGKLVAAYEQREIEYPVEYALDMTIGQRGTENVYALGSLVEWANRKYDAGLTVEELLGEKVEDVYGRLVDLSREWTTGGRLERAVREALGSDGSIADAVVFARERFDTDSIHDVATNNTRLTAKTAGIYYIFGNAGWATNPTNAEIHIWRDGTTTIAKSQVVGDYRHMNVSCHWYLALNEFVELAVVQTSGGDLNISALADYSPDFGMFWVAP
ncbi:hypothetical protein LCGC14_2621820, partial [marine sediment metagenome]